jgi:hypothetical protein
MATYSGNNYQATNEIRTYTIDYSNNLPAGGTITAGTANHTPPSGTAVAVTCIASTPYVYVTVPALTVLGNHYVDVLATFSDNDKSAARLSINVVYPTPTARSGMSAIISYVRELANADVNEFTIAGVPYFSDAHIQTVLDNHRKDFQFMPIEVIPEQVSGSVIYKEFHTEPYIESGALFYLQTADGGTVGTSLYSVDNTRGVITFAGNTAGTAFYATGRTYDINAAASDIWKRKASNASSQVDWSSDNHRISSSQYFNHCMQQASYFQGLAHPISITIYRGDMR